MRNGWAIGALVLAGCWDSARLEEAYDDTVDEARIPPGADVFVATADDGPDPSFCMAYTLGRHSATGATNGRRDVALVDAGYLADDEGLQKPFGLCWSGKKGALQTHEDNHGRGWELHFEDDVVDIRMWSGRGIVALTETGTLRWYAGDADTVDAVPARTEAAVVCPTPALALPGRPLVPTVVDFRVLDASGTVMAVGPEGVAIVDPTGPVRCSDQATGDRVELGEQVAWVRDGDHVAAVDFEGAVLWERTIEGLLHVGGDSDLAATVRDDRGTALRFLDGSSGVEVGRIALPEGTRGAVVDGSRIVSWEDARVASWSF